MEEMMQLSSHEKARLENQKQIYCILRLMNYVEKFYSTDKIDQTAYKTEISKLLQKYTKFSQITPNFSLEDFLKKYNIPHEDVSWAKYVIQKGIEGQQNKEAFLYMQSTSTFIEVIDTLNNFSQNPVIGDIKMALQKLETILKKLLQKLGPEFAIKFKQFSHLMETIIKPKSLSQSLTESEFKEINYSVDSMYKTMQAIVQS